MDFCTDLVQSCTTCTDDLKKNEVFPKKMKGKNDKNCTGLNKNCTRIVQEKIYRIYNNNNYIYILYTLFIQLFYTIFKSIKFIQKIKENLG
jgi:hypothetical protein